VRSKGKSWLWLSFPGIAVLAVAAALALLLALPGVPATTSLQRSVKATLAASSWTVYGAVDDSAGPQAFDLSFRAVYEAPNRLLVLLTALHGATGMIYCRVNVPCRSSEEVARGALMYVRATPGTVPSASDQFVELPPISGGFGSLKSTLESLIGIEPPPYQIGHVSVSGSTYSITGSGTSNFFKPNGTLFRSRYTTRYTFVVSRGHIDSIRELQTAASGLLLSSEQATFTHIGNSPAVPKP